MQSSLRNWIHFVLAFAIAIAPVTPSYVYAAPVPQPASIGERLKVWVSGATQWFRTKDPKSGQEVAGSIQFDIVEGNNEAETTGAVLDQSQGPVLFISDEQEDQAVRDRVAQSPNANNIEFISVNTPNKPRWKTLVRQHVGNALDAGRRRIANLSRNHSFRAIVLSIAGNGTGCALTVWMTNTTFATGVALSAVVAAMGVFSNMSIRGHEPYAILLNKGADSVYKAATYLARVLRKNAAPKESVIRRAGMLLAGFTINLIPTAVIFLITHDAVLSAPLLFANLRNSWDTPIDVKIQDLYVAGKISYAAKKKLMGVKSFAGPIIDNLAVSNFSIAGVPVAQGLAFGLAFAGTASIFLSERIGRAYEAGSVHVQIVASKTRQAGLAIANSFGRGSRRVASAVTARRRAQEEERTLQAARLEKRSCMDFLTGAVGHFEPESWAGRHHRAADDMN